MELIKSFVKLFNKKTPEAVSLKRFYQSLFLNAQTVIHRFNKVFNGWLVFK